MGGGTLESALRDGSADPDLRLIETMRWDGAAVPRLALHQARLARSAAALGWPAPDPRAMQELLSDLPATPLRLRLTLAASGAMQVQTAALPATRPLWRVRLHPEPLRSDDPWLRVKSTRRAAYDRARSALPKGLDEWLFVNERGELAEGTITTIFFDRGRGLRTPPLSSGCLPGVLRAELAVPEEVLPVQDLGRVRLWVGNALRGLIPAALC